MPAPTYAYTKTLHGRGFDQTLTDVVAALKEEGFGVITEIDVQKTMKDKLDKDFRRYRILGACNPGFAHGVLSRDLFVGLLLPCNVVVFDEHEGGEDGCTTVSIAKPLDMLRVAARDDLADLAVEVDVRLQRVIERLGAACPEHA